MSKGRACAFCGYDLAALKASRDLTCPECGRVQTLAELTPPGVSFKRALIGMCGPPLVAALASVAACGILMAIGVGRMGKAAWAADAAWMPLVLAAVLTFVSPVMHAIRLRRDAGVEEPRWWLAVLAQFGVLINAIFMALCFFVAAVLLMIGGFVDVG